MKNLDSGIDQLIERVRKEAIEKAKNERDEMLLLAKKEAEQIIASATIKAQALLEETTANILKERRKFNVELELAARDFSIKLEERLREQMFFPIIKESVRANLKEPDFLKEVLQRLIVEYIKENPCNLDMLVPKELRTTLAAYFAGEVFDSLDKNSDLRLIDEDGIEGFALIKRQEHYVWDFRVETIAKELMRLIEPSLRRYFIANVKTSPLESSKSATV